MDICKLQFYMFSQEFIPTINPLSDLAQVSLFQVFVTTAHASMYLVVFNMSML